jgi:hypothetical protein
MVCAGLPLTNVLASRQHKLYVCYIQKVGCSSWIHLMFDAVGRPYRRWEDLERDPPLPPQAASLVRPRSICNAGWARLVTVRAPHDRLLSGYLEKCVCPTCDSGDQRRNHCINAHDVSRSAPTFSAWVDMLRQPDVSGSKANGHFRRQVDFCGLLHSQQSYTHVLNLSDPSFARTARRVLASHGVAPRLINRSFPLHWAGRGHSTNARSRDKLCSHYDEAAWNKVAQLYALDFQHLFGGHIPTFESVCNSTWGKEHM